MTEEEFNKLDKRTKSYKQWKAKFEQKQDEAPNGLGDTVEAITTKTGIKKVVKMVVGDDCGCDERKEKLNKVFKYTKPVCATEEEYAYLSEWFSNPKNTIRPSEQKELLKIYNRVLRHNKKPTSCASCFRAVIKELKKYYENY